MNSPEADTSRGTVVFLSGDLIFSSRVRAAAHAAGLEFKLSGKVPEDIEGIRYVVLDLASRGGLTEQLPSICAQRCPSAKLIAFGPHVQAGRLTAAKDAGIPVVLTRGQFDAKLSTLFQ